MANENSHSGTPSLEKQTSGDIKPFKLEASCPSDLLNFEAPDSGRDAWMTVAGAWMILFGTFGYLYSFGVYQDYYTRVFLSEHSTSKIAWIGSFQITMPFLMGIFSGKLFDAGYFHQVEILGSVVFTLSLFMLSLANPGEYFQVFLSQGVGMGLGLGLTFVPSLGILVHHFDRRKGLATGIAMSGSSIGALIFPIMLNHLIPSIGFGKAVRASAYIVLGFLCVGNCLVRTDYNRVRSRRSEHPLSIKSFFVDPPYMWAVLAALLSTIGIYFPLLYIQLFAIKHNLDPVLAFYSIAIINGSATVARVSANYFTDIYGPFNILIPITICTSATIFAILRADTISSLIVISAFYGFFSGAWLSVAVSALASLSRGPHETGARIGLALALSSFGSLGAAPIQGALLGASFLWDRPTIFSGVMMASSAAVFTIIRILLVRERGTNKV